MGYNLLINGVYWGYNPFTNHLLTSWDIQACIFLLKLNGTYILLMAGNPALGRRLLTIYGPFSFSGKTVFSWVSEPSSNLSEINVSSLAVFNDVAVKSISLKGIISDHVIVLALRGDVFVLWQNLLTNRKPPLNQP